MFGMAPKRISQSYDTVRRALRPTQGKRILFFLVADSVMIVASLAIAFGIRFDFASGVSYYSVIAIALPLFLAVKLSSFAFFRLYVMSWRFVSLRDLSNIFLASLSASSVLVVVIYFFRIDAFREFPRGVLIIDGIVSFILIASLRIGKRVVFEVVRRPHLAGKGKATIIIGAGNTGEMVLRDIQRTQFSVYEPVAFLDDDQSMVGTYLHGIRVRGTLDVLDATIREVEATIVIIAIQSLGHQQLRKLYQQAKSAGVHEIKIVPRLYDIHHPQIRLHAMEDLKVEDLIRRQAVRVDYAEIGAALEEKRVLITGAAGSIGSEIVRQVCRFRPRELVLFEIDETELHAMQLAINREFHDVASRIRYVVGDVRDRDHVNGTFERYRPEVVFHAAAYKHVPMMELNPAEAVKSNIIGTRNVASAAQQIAAERFVLISTDKAVRPTNVMGATKRIAEEICRAFNAEGGTMYLSVRFGNVLGSRGSVLPIFLDQLQRGGPLTITHKGMRRYFMTIPEAVSLVLQASVIGRGGEVLVLDMGDPVAIVELAEELIRLHRLRPYEDIGIEYIGVRPGEKLFEEPLSAEEGVDATRHEKVFVAKKAPQFVLADAEQLVEQFHILAQFPDRDGVAIRKLLREHVRWYEPGHGMVTPELPAQHHAPAAIAPAHPPVHVVAPVRQLEHA